MENIILLGMGGHAHSVVDSLEQAGRYNIIGFLDTEEMQGKRFRDYEVLNTDDALQEYFNKGIRNAFVTIGFMGQGTTRNRLYDRVKEIGYTVPNIVDQTAIISESAEFGDGIFIGKNTVINAEAKIGTMCIINTGAIVEHDCTIGAFSHIAVGAMLCGSVVIGEETLIGAGATVIQQKMIGSRCMIGAGTTVREDTEDNSMVYNDKNIKKIGGGGNSLL